MGTAQFYLTITYFFDFFSQLLFSLNKGDYLKNQLDRTCWIWNLFYLWCKNDVYHQRDLSIFGTSAICPLVHNGRKFFLSLCPRNSHLFKSDDDDNEEVNGERSCPISSFCPSINARKTGRSMLSGTSCKKGQFDGRYQTIFGFKLPTNPYSSLFRRALYASRALLFFKQKIF